MWIRSLMRQFLHPHCEWWAPSASSLSCSPWWAVRWTVGHEPPARPQRRLCRTTPFEETLTLSRHAAWPWRDMGRYEKDMIIQLRDRPKRLARRPRSSGKARADAAPEIQKLMTHMHGGRGRRVTTWWSREMKRAKLTAYSPTRWSRWWPHANWPTTATTRATVANRMLARAHDQLRRHSGQPQARWRTCIIAVEAASMQADRRKTPMPADA